MSVFLKLLLVFVSCELSFLFLYIITGDEMFLTWFSKKFLSDNIEDSEDREEED